MGSSGGSFRRVVLHGQSDNCCGNDCYRRCSALFLEQEGSGKKTVKNADIHAELREQVFIGFQKSGISAEVLTELLAEEKVNTNITFNIKNSTISNSTLIGKDEK